jgi:short-subunit dehydrogenase
MALTALITGASTGIGLELSKLLKKDGYELFEVSRHGPIPADLSDASSPARVIEALGGRIPDVLINNAGFGMAGKFTEIELQTQLDMIQLNVTSLVELTHRLLPGMLARGNGRIMNVASTAAFVPGPLRAIYYATKAFVLSFSEALSEELRGTGVTVTVLCPGPTLTEFQKRARMEESKLFKGGAKIMSAEEVARIGYEAMLEGKVVSIAGLANGLGIQGLRLAPRSIVRRMVYKLNSN